jgi:hypothetical protein
MTSQELGSSFEILTEKFFLWLFENIQVQVNNHWVQKAGYQFGFDVGFEIAVLKDDFFKRGIYIECKNYQSTTLLKSQLHDKLIQFDMSSYDKKDSIFIFLSPKVDLKEITQDSNPKLLEDYFNSCKNFKTIILTPNNRIKEIFSLNQSIFNKVYDNELFNELDINGKESILEYFKKFLYSKGEIPNFNDISIKKKYLEIASTTNEEHIYISRTLKTNKFSFLNDDKNLLDIIKENNIVLLLGEPGSGKTTELINVSNYFENRISNLEIIPIFISLSNVKKFDKIEDILPINWELNKKIVFLLDSLDEFEFKNYLLKEIEYLFEHKEISLKIVISCRTYAYNDELASLKPAKFYLDGFNINQSMRLLNKQFNVSLEEYDKIEKDKFKDILEDPFMVNRLGQYYTNHKAFPSSVFDVYEDIKTELSYEDIEVYKIFALILELTKNSSIRKTELRSLFGLKYNRLIKLKFIQKSFDKESFKFIHKNYQEYFASLALSDLSFDEIINFIVVKDTNKTHPSLFNTITFLINILDISKYSLLVDWLIENQIEILFKADTNRIEGFRVEIFQKYFEKECIKKTFWISKNKTFTVKEIAQFADCEENFYYLCSIIKDEKNHFRIVISSLELLSFFTISLNKKDEFKNDLLNLLKRKSISDSIKSHILDCIDDQKLHIDDYGYLNKIFDLFKNETSKEINRALLSLIKYYEPIDIYFWYIKEEFLRDKKINPRKIDDEVMRGNSWILEKIIIRLQKYSNFINLVKYYFDETKNNYADNRFAEEVIERCLFFENKEDDFLVRLLASFEEKEKYYLRENLLKTLILKSSINSQIKAFNYLIENFTFNNVGYFLASITNKDTISVIIKKFIDGSIENKELDFFRNVIANHGNRELAGEFNNIMIEKGFIFNQIFLFEKEYQELKIKYENKPQDNFDILFNRPQLLSEIKDIFTEYGDSIKPEIIREIDLSWYEKNGHSNKIDIAYSLLTSLIYKNKKTLTFIEVEELLQDEFIFIKEIMHQIKGLNDTNNKFTVKAEQIFFINQWCEKTSVEIRFGKVMQFININRFSVDDDYEKLKTVLFFMFKFNFDLPQEFLLNSIEFFDIEKSDDEDNNFEMLKLKINDDILFKKTIIENLLNKKLFSFLLNKHIQYVLDNNLTETFFKIKDYFLMGDFNYNLDQKLEQYFKLTNDIELLKELCSDVKSHGCWSVIKILMGSKIEEDLCVNKAIEYLETKIDAEKNYYYSNALAILFELKSLEALKYFNLFLNLDNIPSLKESSFANYDIIGDYNVLEDLFNKIYMGDRDEIGYSGVSNFLTTYISNLSRTEEGHDKTMSKLHEIKTKIEKTEIDNGLFYINILIDDSQNSYINSKSKPLSFNEALVKVEEILS